MNANYTKEFFELKNLETIKLKSFLRKCFQRNNDFLYNKEKVITYHQFKISFFTLKSQKCIHHIFLI